MRKKLSFLFTPWFMGVLFILFVLSMAIATFIENDYGAQVAIKVIYNSIWFELIMLFMVANLIGQIFRYKLYKRKKITVLLFHSAFIIMIIGAGITRYIGFEGRIHIREGETQNICQSQEKFVRFSIYNEEGVELLNNSKKLTVTSVSSDSYSMETMVDDIDYSLEFVKYLPNAAERIISDPNGKPIVLLIVSKGMMRGTRVILSEGEIFQNNALNISFNGQDSAELSLSFKADSFYISAIDEINEMSMKTREMVNYPKNTTISLAIMKMYNYKGWRIVVQELNVCGVSAPVSLSRHTEQTGRNALQFELCYGNKAANLFVWDGEDMPAEFKTGNHLVQVNYGHKSFKIPFKLKLNDFIVERYPGSSSPSSYKSDVLLIDEERGIEEPALIYMNNILKYGGYRFYQSSYDKDELGTILSVNHDNAGMLVTYAGYFLLFLSIIFSMVNKNSVFRTINEKFWNSSGKKAAVILLFIMLGSGFSYGNQQLNSIDKKKADEFGKILVQDQKGRTKPLLTLSNDILRKVSRQEEYNGYSSMQVFLGLYYDFDFWKDEPLIKVSNAEVKSLIGIRGSYASFADIVDLQSNTYKLSKHINDAYKKAPGARTKFDKGIMKLDERVNICYMISKGEFLKIFPLNNESEKWGTMAEAVTNAINEVDSLYVQNILNLYFEAALKGSVDGNYEKADEYLNSIKDYQIKHAKYSLPSETRIRAEVFYYKSQIFEKLFPYYALLGLVLLIILITQIIKGRKIAPSFIIIVSLLLFVGLISHSAGLALRWYISGHAPMSNGYESMIFISWVTILAGFIFSKKSKFALAATAVLSSLTLMVAHLSFMDPEITNLVPVLKSYWLTLHVSVITGSYGFLGLGAILGLIVLILYSLSNGENKERISTAIKELSVLNYKTLTIGLYLLTIGTFLGAVWANESWGRYWGWDPKETWSLITIIVYSFVIHSKMITTFKNIYIFNFLSLFAFSSVLMTYFGVNYYLSGLHSYGAGDSIPIPTFVYVSVISVFVLALFAHRRYIKNF